MHRKILILHLVVLAALISCASRGGLEEASMKIKGHELTVELAKTAGDRQTGLMNREEMDADRGMLFIFEEEAPRNFWMKNTLIPLSIAYMDREGVILNIEDMEPLDLTPVPSAGSAMYALEVNQGLFHQWGVRPGYRLVLPGEAFK